MFSKSVAVGFLALTCIAAAAGGAYLAVRQNEVPAGGLVGPVLTSGAESEGAVGVKETEALITPGRPGPEDPGLTGVEAGLDTPVARELETGVAGRLETPVWRGPSVAEPQPVGAPASRAPRRAPAERPADTRRAAAAARPAPPAAVPAPAPRPAAASPAESIDLETASAAPVDKAPGDERPRAAVAPVPSRLFDELVVPASSVIGLQVETPVSSERARVEDRVEARVLRDVTVDGRTALPAGARAVGTVTIVEEGGKMRERARLGVRFHTLVLADGTELPMRTETIIREGEPPSGESARKIGGAAVGGAILGAIIGGKKGAIIGGATGAAGGSAAVMAGGRNPATLPVGAVVTVRLSAPVSVEVERR